MFTRDWEGKSRFSYKLRFPSSSLTYRFSFRNFSGKCERETNTEDSQAWERRAYIDSTPCYGQKAYNASLRASVFLTLLWILLLDLHFLYKRLCHLLFGTLFHIDNQSDFQHLWVHKVFALGYRFYDKMETIVKQGIPAAVLEEKALAFKKAKVANNPLKDEIPKATALYETTSSMWNKIKGLKQQKCLDLTKGGEPVNFHHLATNEITGEPNCVIDIPIVPNTHKEVFSPSDFIIQKKQALGNALHVGAIEVIINSYASPESNLMGGMVLVDTCHEDSKNAIRSIFIAPFRGGRPVRVVAFPNTLVPLNSNINERFKLVCTVPNCDFKQGQNLASVTVNMAGCTTSIARHYTPTRLMTEELEKEGAVIVEYLGRSTYAMQTSNVPTAAEVGKMNFDFQLQKPLKLKQVEGGAQFCSGTTHSFSVKGIGDSKVPAKEDKPKIQSSISGVDPVHNYVRHGFPQASLDMFKLTLDETVGIRGTLLDQRIAQTKVLLSKSLAGGTTVLGISLYDLFKGSSHRAYIALTRTHKIEGELKCLASISMPENTGCCLAMCVNSGARGKFNDDIYTVGSQDRVIWNPSCKLNCVFSFNPNPASDCWSLEFLKRTKTSFSVTCVSGWTTTPQTDLQMTLDWMVSAKPCVPRTYCLEGSHSELVMNRWMGKLTFEQGVTGGIRRMPLALGGGAGADASILMNMPNAYLSLWRYFRGDLEFELTKMSSPYIKATICFFIAFGDLEDGSPNVEDYPNHLIQFSEIQDAAKIVFTQENFLTAWSTQVDPKTSLVNDGCPYLYAVIHDCVSSTIPGFAP